MTQIGFVGPGRAGLGLGLALARSGYDVRLHGRRHREVPTPLELTVGGVPPWLDSVEVIILAVPDDALATVASQLSESGSMKGTHTVLHLSGALDRAAIAVLAPYGCALGSLHPLQSLSDPGSAPTRLRGAAAAVEGDERAVRMAGELARAVGLEPIRIPSESKSLYHAAAVFASNYVVTVTAAAHRLLEQVGLSEAEARAALAPIIRGTVENIVEHGPERALTGPVVRGDRTTIARHLEALPDDEAALYRALGRAALKVADLSATEREEVERLLEYPDNE